MRVRTVKGKHGSISYAIIKDVVNKNGKRSTQIVESLGNHADLSKEYPGRDPLDVAKERAKELTAQAKEGKITIQHQIDLSQLIKKNTVNGGAIGHFFINKLYYELKLDQLCKKLSQQHKITFDLNDILATLIASRILSPGSKNADYVNAQQALFTSDFDLHHIYRALDIFSDHFDEIQTHLYQESLTLCSRDTSVLFYDCTNFFFELEVENGFKQYGKSKEHRPNPIIQMGLFMDGSGLPLAFTLFPGNQNEQPTLKPLEKRIIKEFNLSEFIISTDAGLGSQANRRFNHTRSRRFVTVQSLKTLRKELKEWALHPNGWKRSNDSSNKIYDLSTIDELSISQATFYKELWQPRVQSKEEKRFGIRPLEERYIVTYSPKYKHYQASVRNRQIDRAKQKLNTSEPLANMNPNSPTRFVTREVLNETGETVTEAYELNEEKIHQEAQYDGFYCVATNSQLPVEEILAINHRRWEIEETFRILKTHFKSRPVYLNKDNRIQAHFLICFIALLIYRLIEKKTNEKFTCQELIQTLRSMSLAKLGNQGYFPTYTRTAVTDQLHEMVGFRTDLPFITRREMKKIQKIIKNKA